MYVYMYVYIYNYPRRFFSSLQLVNAQRLDSKQIKVVRETLHVRKKKDGLFYFVAVRTFFPLKQVKRDNNNDT